MYDAYMRFKAEGNLAWKTVQGMTGIPQQRLYRYFYETIEYRLYGNVLTREQRDEIELVCIQALRGGINIWKNKRFQQELKRKIKFNGHRVEFMVFINNLRRHRNIVSVLKDKMPRAEESDNELIDLFEQIMK